MPDSAAEAGLASLLIPGPVHRLAGRANEVQRRLISTSDGDVGRGEPLAGSTVIPTLSPAARPETTMGPTILPCPEPSIMPADLVPAGPINQSS